ncbi:BRASSINOSTEROID INSENSITIVE 1-associated receptor kinase 1-like [Syzygium oleosum]|uniref:BRASSINOSTEROID INSENSITIVE 1-associated receptor kinase 1-like n=1 Tax=Syzygium oleosum TaxID=219896 RepID=UPI0011D27211|nr:BRASSINOSTEROID INSENSITIVE 1-associated receptor kinase 1-like [Syzygium oleosum]
MVFRFATFDPAQDPDDFNPAFPPTPSSSPSVTLCQPCEYTRTFTKTIVRRLVAAGASLVLTAPALELRDDEIRDRYAETPFHSINFDVRPEFHRRQLKEFTLKELKVATRNFSDEKLIGRGGFGGVYEGQLADGSLVAIKRYRTGSAQGIIEFEREVMVGSIIPLRHNLLPLLGFCRSSECRDLLLVSPLMVNKSVDCCLSKRRETRPPLDWLTRRKIAVGAARGLSRLHDLSIVHLDIKPSNILLDEEFEPHIGDFGLVKLTDRRRGEWSVDGIEEAPVLPRNESEAGSHGEDSYFTDRICGTYGYMAPEYAMEGKYSVKTDVFAFGITLLELVTGQRATRVNGRSVMLGDWVKRLLVEGSWEIVVDFNLQGEYDHEEIEKVIKLALLCTHPVPRVRPHVAQVIKILEGHSIEEAWEEYHHSKEYLIPLMQLPTLYQTGDVSSSLLSPEELSGPR